MRDMSDVLQVTPDPGGQIAAIIGRSHRELLYGLGTWVGRSCLWFVRNFCCVVVLLLLLLKLLSLPCGPEGTGAMLERSISPEWLAFLRMSAAVDYVHEEAKALLKELFSGEAVCIKSTLFPIRSPETSVRHTHK